MNLDHELRTAIETACAAGELLRAAFHKPEHSSRGASLDKTVEAMIRERLGRRFPCYGQLGEELHQLDRPPSDDGAHTWVIDPLDGTSHFERGRRGASVSIALLRGAVPVLGVVFSPLCPNDHGDLIHWAEGQPLRRNGNLVRPRALATRLRREHTVLLAPAAEYDLEAASSTVAPARFRVMPSIAYRLALAAVGDAEAAVSTNAPCAHDYAAGHALLRAVGANLFDAHGRPITYGLDGHGDCGGTCVGASRTIAEALAESLRAAPVGLAGRRLRHATPDLRGSTIADPGLLSRAQGCLIGLVASDSLGSLCEFQPAGQIAREYPGGVRLLAEGGAWNTLAGQPTDDSELALALARSLVARRRYDADAVARAYGDWCSSSPFDIGITTAQAFGPASRDTQNPAAAARQSASASSQSNGALMRIAPLSVFGWDLPQTELARLAREDAALSHPHRVCQDANVVYVLALQRALKTGCDGASTYRFARDCSKDQGVCDEVIQWLRDAEERPPADFQSHMGWVKIAFQNAFHQLLHAASLEEGVVNTVASGGDTDTNAAICGALLGAVHGLDAIPRQWLDRVLTCRPMAGAPGVQRPRPSTYWPTDALEFAEQLLRAA